MRVCRYSQVGKSGGGGDVGVAVGMIVKLWKNVCLQLPLEEQWTLKVISERRIWGSERANHFLLESRMPTMERHGWLQWWLGTWRRGLDAVSKYPGVLHPVNHCGCIRMLCYCTVNVDAETYICWWVKAVSWKQDWVSETRLKYQQLSNRKYQQLSNRRLSSLWQMPSI